MSRHVQISLKMWPLVFGIFLVLSLNKLEHLFMPVVRDFVVLQTQRDGNNVIMSGYMRKSRSCQYAGVTAEAMVGDTWADVPLQYLDTVNHTATRPTGTQGWGPWRITLPVQPGTTTLRLTAAHKCHPFWLSQTELINMPILEIPR